MELVWSDEFDGDAVNLDNWTYDIGGWGWGNGEAQYYTDRPENARPENGCSSSSSGGADRGQRPSRRRA